MSLRHIEPVSIVASGLLRAASFVWLASDGRPALTLVCKATYVLAPDVSRLAQDQDEIHANDILWGDERKSVRAPSDFVPFKRRVDILVAGHAYAPRGRPARSLFARLIAAGAISKTVAVYGDRGVLSTGELTRPAEFEAMPLRWERAAGGPGTENPAGVAPASFGAASPSQRAPNIQPPEVYVASASDTIPPAGMGAIAPNWPARAQKLGRSAASWDHRTWHARPLPDDLDGAYFNSAPLDQQAEHLTPDQHLLLEHLHPEHARLSTRLAGIVPRAFLRHALQPDRAIHLRCDTLWIDTDRGVCCVTWRGAIAFETIADAEIHVAFDHHQAFAPATTSTTAADDEGTTATLVAPASAPPPVSASPPAPAPALDAAPVPALASNPVPVLVSAPRATPMSATETVPLGARSPTADSPLPFSPATPGVVVSVTAPSAPREARVPDDDGTATLPEPLVLSTSVLPFGAVAPGEPPAPSPLPTPLPQPLSSPSPPLIARPTAHALDDEPPSDPGARAEQPPPPAMLAPIAPTPEGSREPVRPTDPASPTLAPDALSLVHWAELLAELDKAHRPRADVLHDHDLTERDLAAVDRHWRAVLARETASGGFVLRFEHDAAYVGALERLRGSPLTAAEYARILAAAERRQVAATLHDLAMPAAAHLPIVRQWTAKLARDPKLSFEMIQAVAGAREGGAPGPRTS